MSRTVCSWCQNPFVENKDGVLVCKNTECPACAEEFLHKELDRTRKALDVAMQFLESLRSSEDSPFWVIKHTNRKIEQINEITKGNK